ncbi:MAG: hypothetical protein K0U98_08280 [Deltaproteobacteria bacterium]|nr:hypothetical protein [Deltaproteobacteria bacterium]
MNLSTIQGTRGSVLGRESLRNYLHCNSLQRNFLQPSLLRRTLLQRTFHKLLFSARAVVAGPVAGGLIAGGLIAAAPIGAQEFALSPDTTAILAAVTVADEAMVKDDILEVTPIDLGPLPVAADVTAYHQEGAQAFFSLATTTELADGLIATPRDVVVWDGNGYGVFFSGAAEGVPAGARIDAFSMAGTILLLSFDVSVILDGDLIADEDLVKFSGGFALTFDASAEGIASSLDLDGASQLSDGRLALSFDGSGTVGGVAFDDEDVVAFDTVEGWEVLYDGSSLDQSWGPSDLDALYVIEEPPPTNMIFADGFETGDTSAWSLTHP